MTDRIIDIIAFSIPAVVVFITVYYLFTRFLKQQLSLEHLKFQQAHGKEVLPLKLQAYERLIMLCERMSVEPLALRLLHPDMGVKELKSAMLIAIQQEFEHNLTQQLYVSENLWQIIKVAKEQMQSVVSAADAENPTEFVSKVNEAIASLKVTPLAFAVTAIKNEASLLM